MDVIGDGEWVEIVDCDLEGCKGYVVDYSDMFGLYFVQIIKDSKGARADTIRNFKSHYIRKIPLELHKEDFQEMINFSLDTEDKKWFRKLSKRVDRAKLMSYSKGSY